MNTSLLHFTSILRHRGTSVGSFHSNSIFRRSNVLTSPILMRRSNFSASINYGARNGGFLRIQNRIIAFYRQTSQSVRRFGRNHFDFESNPHYAVYAIIAANTAIFCAWKVSQSDYRLAKFMAKNFTISSNGVLSQHRYHTMLTSFFSHSSGQHLFFNMFSLFFFGVEAATYLGLSRFCMLYFGGGLISSAAFVAWPYIGGYFGISRRNFRYRGSEYELGLGASGAVSSLIGWSVLTNPTRMVYLFAILPVPAALFGLGYVASGLYGIYNGNKGEVAHLGGFAFGLLYYLKLRLRRFR